MKTNFLFILFFISNFLFCQKKESAIAVISSVKNFNIYHNSSGNKIKFKIQQVDDDYYELELIKKDKNRFYANINCVLCSGKNKVSWVDIKYAEIGLRSSNNNSINIYPKPHSKYFKNTIKIHTESVIANVLDFKDNWLKVSFYWNGKTTIGWLAPENQCENFYTMCTG